MSEYAQIDAKLQRHFEDDDVRFKEINEKLDSILEVMSAFKMGGRGVAWFIGFLVACGSLVLLVMKIFFGK